MTESNKVERMLVVDALRGFALAGIVVAHMYEQFIAAPRPAGGWGGYARPWRPDHWRRCLDSGVR